MMMIVARLECWSVLSVTPATTSPVTTRPQDALGVSARKTGTASQTLRTNIFSYVIGIVISLIYICDM